MTSPTTPWTQIKVLSISDIHLGCPSNPAESVIVGLDKLLDNDALRGLDLLYIVGDVFDRGLTAYHKDVAPTISWMRRLLSRCAFHNVTVIVVEGTPSHDRLQSQLFVALNDAADEKRKCDLRYIKEVQIEYIEKYDLNILVIPDEKNTSDEITLKQVKSMMQARALEKVDFALIHGFFDFQVPVGHNCRFHDSEVYLALVRYLTFVGHDHTFRKKDRIFVQGSPDRQRHGTEEDKGCIKATVQRDGTFEATFVVNKNAMVFKTVMVSDDLDLANRQICDAADTQAGKGHLRIAAQRGHASLNSIEQYEALYPFIRFSKKVLEDKDENVDGDLIKAGAEENYVPFSIDSSNIKTIVGERLASPLNAEEQAYFDNLMESVMGIKA